jgi:hypothetical protein
MIINENNLIFERYISKSKIKGGLADGKTCQDIANKHKVPLKNIKSQMKKGIKIEMEHTEDTSIATEIALDHLWEFPDYYTELEKMENLLKKRWMVKETYDKKYEDLMAKEEPELIQRVLDHFGMTPEEAEGMGLCAYYMGLMLEIDPNEFSILSYDLANALTHYREFKKKQARFLKKLSFNRRQC